MIRRPPRSTLSSSSAASDVYKRQLENTEKIRILIGISTNKQTHDLLNTAKQEQQQSLQFSHAEAKKEIEGLIEKEMEESEDNRNVEQGIAKFIEWIHNKKLEIRAYPCLLYTSDAADEE